MKIRQWLVCGIFTFLSGGGVIVQAGEHDTAAMLAKQEIEYLQRWYARATDLIGSNLPDQIEEGRDIYHRIFTKQQNNRRTYRKGDHPTKHQGSFPTGD